MPRRKLLAVAFLSAAVAVAFAAAPPAQAQVKKDDKKPGDAKKDDKKPGIQTPPPTTAKKAPAKAGSVQEELFETFDGAKLRGYFYKSDSAKNGSVVLMMHGYMKDPTKGDWDGLARTLAGNGLHVLRFDFRGHGPFATDVRSNQFWQIPANRNQINGGTKSPPKGEFSIKDLRNQGRNYFPMLVNDLAAARAWLDTQNDAGTVNTSSIYLVGAGEMATLGMLFLATEWRREAVVPNATVPPQFVSARRGLVVGSKPAGPDYAGAVWLSPTGHPSIPPETVKVWVQQAPQLREDTPMLFLHGEEDRAGEQGGKYLFNEALVAKPRAGTRLSPLPQTFLREVAGSKRLSGVDLLGKNLVEEQIAKFLSQVEDERKNRARISRNYTAPLRIDLASFGVNAQ